MAPNREGLASHENLGRQAWLVPFLDSRTFEGLSLDHSHIYRCIEGSYLPGGSQDEYRQAVPKARHAGGLRSTEWAAESVLALPLTDLPRLRHHSTLRENTPKDSFPVQQE